MTYEKPLDLARTLLAATLAERARDYADALEAIIAKQAARGMALSGGTLVQVGRRAETEIKERAHLVVETTRRILADEIFEPLDDLLHSFKEHAETTITAAYVEVWNGIIKLGAVKQMARSNANALEAIQWEIADVRNREIEKSRAEIEIAGRAKRARRPGRSTVGTHRLVAIVALDVKGYSARAEENESKAIDEVMRLRSTILEIAQAHGGRMFNSAGDGFMLEFGSATDAVNAARVLAVQCRPTVRIGVHVGDVTADDRDDLLGHAVNVAARLQQACPPGSALVSNDARRLVRDSVDGLPTEGKVISLPKMTEKVEVFEITPDQNTATG